MSWVSRNRHWILLALVAVTTVLAVGTVGVGLLIVLAGLAGGAGLGTVLGNAALVVLVAAVLVAADLALAVAFLVTVARRASLPGLSSVENEWAATRLERAEAVFPPLARLGLADRVAVSNETKRERLKQRYVDGELTEPEYERRLRTVLDEEDGDTAATDVDALDADLAAGRSATDDVDRAGVTGESDHETSRTELDRETE